MKEIADYTGRFQRRPYYECAELDRECEDLICKYLKKKHGQANFPVSTDDLTTLLEAHVEDLDLYADLSSFGQSVEGVTIFNPGGRPSVKITAALADDAHRENRLRTTLTHEFGHAHFHAYLWTMEQAEHPELKFGKGVQAPSSKNVQICKRETIIDAPERDWMEWQAGHVCGAILMPASRVRGLILEAFDCSTGPSTWEPNSAPAQNLIATVQTAFSVSKEAAKVRLLRLGILQPLTPFHSLF